MSDLKKDFIIVGQGLAGTLLARLLLQAGKTVHIIDAAHRGSSTKVAAGIVNPVTGRRFAKSWIYGELYSAAEKMYREIEQESDLELFQETKIIRVLTNAEQENEWYSRSIWPEMKAHMDGPPSNFPCQQHFKSVFSLTTTRGGAQVNIAKLIEHFQEKWLQENLLSFRDFNYEQLNLLEDGIQYQELQAGQIIFCEGHAVRHNPWFNNLPWEMTKGEVLHLRVPGYTTNYIVKHHLLYAPLSPGIFWVGSNYENGNNQYSPSEKGKSWLLERIERGLNSDYEIVNHKASIRPNVKDRRPLIGRHPAHPQLILFNGLGAKGTSQGPFFARQLVRHLLQGIPLSSEVDIQRYLD